MSVELGPLPEPKTRTDWHKDGYGKPAYTADQMRAYAEAEVLKERERCAKACESMGPVMCEIYGAGAECIATADACAEAIRRG